MEFNNFTILALQTQLLKNFPDLIGISIINLEKGSVNLADCKHVLIIKLFIRDMVMFFEFDLFEDTPVLNQCFDYISKKIDDRYFYPPKSKPLVTLMQQQIINCLMYNTCKTIEDYDYDIFKILASEATYNNLHLDDGQKYICDKFSENGDWYPLLNGNQNIKVKTFFG